MRHGSLPLRCAAPFVGAVAALALAAWPGAAWSADDTSGCGRCHANMFSKAVGGHAALAREDCRACHEPAPGAGVCKGPRTAWRTAPASDRLCADCHKPRTPEGQTAHTAYTRGRCSSCHDPHGNARPRALTEDTKQLCLRCHGPKGSGAKRRIGVTEKGLHAAVRMGGGCTGCHVTTHASAEPALLKDKVGALCEGCHDAEEKAVHAPVVKGDCTGCHDPHGPSPKPKLLRATGLELCLLCHGAGAPANAAEARVDLRLPSVHKPIREGRCDACHAGGHGGSEPKLLSRPAQELCGNCHPKIAQDKSPHEPVKNGECTSCHEPHASASAPLLVKKRETICLGCHRRKDMLTRAFPHSPVSEGRCLDCHSAHGLNAPHLLLAEGKGLCLRCHDGKSELTSGAARGAARLDLKQKVTHAALKSCKGCHTEGHDSELPNLLLKPPAELCADCHDRKDQSPFPHTAARVGDCTGCHAPHTSANEDLLWSADGAALCFRCHQDDVTGRKVVHQPVEQRKCGACHDPHGSQHPFSLKSGRNKDACGGCHKPMDVGKVRHAVLDRQGCTACHDAHASANRWLLPVPVNELCARCHPKQQDGLHVSTMTPKGHKVTGGRDPRKTDRDFTCVSCHDPHGSDNARLFYLGETPMESCDMCHGNLSGKHPEAKDIARLNRPEPSAPNAPNAPPTEGGGGP